MVNLIGRMPPRAAVLAQPGVHLHDYGKSARPGRKLGHCTLVAPSARERDRRTRQLLRVLARALGAPPIRATLRGRSSSTAGAGAVKDGMYLTRFKLKEAPFEANADARYLYLSRATHAPRPISSRPSPAPMISW